MGADVVAASLEGVFDIVLAAIARAGRQTDVWRAHEVSSFAISRDVEVSDDFCDG